MRRTSWVLMWVFGFGCSQLEGAHGLETPEPHETHATTERAAASASPVFVTPQTSVPERASVAASPSEVSSGLRATSVGSARRLQRPDPCPSYDEIIEAVHREPTITDVRDTDYEPLACFDSYAFVRQNLPKSVLIDSIDMYLAKKEGVWRVLRFGSGIAMCEESIPARYWTRLCHVFYRPEELQ